MRKTKPYSKSKYYSGTKVLKEKKKFELEVLPKVRLKKELTYDEQIDYMEYKGIKFNLISKKDAKDMLMNRNYYFKLSVYRKLFKKGDNNKYIFLDFKHLIDLSSIDMGIRYFLLQMTLDVEHAAKVSLIHDLTQNSRVNDYLIVSQFKNKNKNFFQNIEKRFAHTKYMTDFHSKRQSQISYWVLIELLDMGGLVTFLNFYVNHVVYKTGAISTDVKNSQKLLVYAKNIRNCTAHSNPFIYNIFDNKIAARSQLVSYANVIGIDSKTIRFDKVNDLVALFQLHKYLCSDILSHRRYKEGMELFIRSKRMKQYYVENEKLKNTSKIFKVLLDFLIR